MTGCCLQYGVAADGLATAQAIEKEKIGFDGLFLSITEAKKESNSEVHDKTISDDAEKIDRKKNAQNDLVDPEKPAQISPSNFGAGSRQCGGGWCKHTRCSDGWCRGQLHWALPLQR